MTHSEQLRRFGSVPIPDCALAKKARQDARKQWLKGAAYSLCTGALMGCLLGAALFSYTIIGG